MSHKNGILYLKGIHYLSFFNLLVNETETFGRYGAKKVSERNDKEMTKMVTWSVSCQSLKPCQSTLKYWSWRSILSISVNKNIQRDQKLDYLIYSTRTVLDDSINNTVLKMVVFKRYRIATPLDTITLSPDGATVQYSPLTSMLHLVRQTVCPADTSGVCARQRRGQYTYSKFCPPHNFEIKTAMLIEWAFFHRDPLIVIQN